jgi:hypothetical protein
MSRPPPDHRRRISPYAILIAIVLAPVACRNPPKAEPNPSTPAEPASTSTPGAASTPATSSAEAETRARIRRGLVGVGDSLPDLTFESLDGPPVALASLRGRPTVLVFGSCTCEPFVGSMAVISALDRDFRDRVAFLLIYIDEAHPTDGWVMPGNPFEVARARSIADRRAAATEFRNRLGVEMPIALESMDLSAERVFGAFPNRLVIADADGTIVAIGPPGPGSTRGSARTAAATLESLLGGSTGR